jgi:hypothetical protein
MDDFDLTVAFGAKISIIWFLVSTCTYGVMYQ